MTLPFSAVHTAHKVVNDDRASLADCARPVVH